MSTEIPDYVPPGTEPAGFMTRAVNVFVSPGELFDDIRDARPSSSTWVIPLILCALLTGGFIYYMFGTPVLRDQMMQAQHEAMQKQVADGKMTAEQADKAEEIMASTWVGIVSAIGGIVVSVIIFFVLALLVWLGMRFMLKYDAPFQKAMEIMGMGTLITSLGLLLTFVTVTLFNSIYATPSAALVVASSFNIHSPLHALLKCIDVFILWQAFVVGLGIARVARGPASKGMMVTFGVYAVYVIVAVAIVALRG